MSIMKIVDQTVATLGCFPMFKVEVEGTNEVRLLSYGLSGWKIAESNDPYDASKEREDTSVEAFAEEWSKWIANHDPLYDDDELPRAFDPVYIYADLLTIMEKNRIFIDSEAIGRGDSAVAIRKIGNRWRKFHKLAKTAAKMKSN